MTRSCMTAALVLLTLVDHAFAQSTARVSDRFDVTVFPAGALIATEGDLSGQAGFTSVVPGGALTVKINRYVGIEGEVSGAFGYTQSLEARGTVLGEFKTPSMLGYGANVVVNLLPSGRRVVPYVAGGIGGVRVFERRPLGLTTDEDYLTGNGGGGLKVMFGRWGLRGDYRFMAMQSTDDAPAFVGREPRYAHRVYGGLVFAPGGDGEGR